MAALGASHRHHANPRPGHHLVPLVLPREGLYPDRHPHPDRVHRGERGDTFHRPLFRPGQRISRANGAAVPGGRMHGLREGVQLRPYVPRGEVQDAPPPHGVLDAGGRGGVLRQRGQHAPPGGHGEPRGFGRACQLRRGACRAGAGRGASSKGDDPLHPHGLR